MVVCLTTDSTAGYHSSTLEGESVITFTIITVRWPVTEERCTSSPYLSSFSLSCVFFIPSFPLLLSVHSTRSGVFSAPPSLYLSPSLSLPLSLSLTPLSSPLPSQWADFVLSDFARLLSSPLLSSPVLSSLLRSVPRCLTHL